MNKLYRSIMYFLFIISIVFLLTTINGNDCYCQIKTFKKSFPDQGNHHQFSSSIIRAGNNQYIIVGRTVRGGNKDDVYLLSISDSGDTLWNRKYGAKEVDDIATFITSANKGDFVVVGMTKTFNQRSDEDAFLIKINTEGKWLKYPIVIGSPNANETARCVIPLKDGGFVLGIDQKKLLDDGSGNSKSSAYVIKIDSNGTRKWEYRYKSNEESWFGGLAIDRKGNFIFAGTTRNPLEGDRDLFFVKLIETGQVKWENIFTPDFNASETVRSVALMPNGNFAVVGMKRTPNYCDPLLVLVNGVNGKVIMEKSYTLGKDAWSNCVIVAKDTNIVMVGNMEAGKGFMLKVNKNDGLKICYNFFDGPLNFIIETPDGGYLSVGDFLPRPISNFWDIYVVKTDDYCKVGE